MVQHESLLGIPVFGRGIFKPRVLKRRCAKAGTAPMNSGGKMEFDPAAAQRGDFRLD
jgi:hypothetical protein